MIVLSNTIAWLDGHTTSQNDVSVKDWTDLVDRCIDQASTDG